MKLKYQLSNDDFLVYQLYTSSKSKMHNKKRFRSRIFLPLIYIAFALYVYFKSENTTLALLFSGVAVLWFFMYPKYSKWTNKKHFKKFVEENYKNRINKPAEIEFSENSLAITDDSSDSRVNSSELKELIETKNYFFIRLATDVSVIVPKAEVEHKEAFKKVVTDLGATYIDELNWEWK